MELFNNIRERVFFKVLIYFLSLFTVAFSQPAWLPSLATGTWMFAICLFWISIKDVSYSKKRFYVSGLWFAGVQWIQLSWMSASEYQGAYIHLVHLLIALALGAQWGLLCLAVPTSRQTCSWSRVLMIPSLWVLMEWSRLYFMSGFAFNPLGLSLTCHIWGKQCVSLAGIYGLSFWVLATNILLYKFLVDQKIAKKLTFWAIASCLPFLFGAIFVNYHSARMQKAPKIRALVVQTALSPIEKTGIQGTEKMVQPLKQWQYIFSHLYPHQASSFDVIALPECSVPYDGDSLIYGADEVFSLISFYFKEKGEALYEKLFQSRSNLSNLDIAQFLSEHFKSPVLIGLEEITSEQSFYASAYYLYPGKKPQSYQKRVLLPIVEYLPFDWCKKIAQKYQITGWFERGNEPKVFEGKTSLLPSICIEELYGHLIREAVPFKPALMVNITNDVWFPNSKLPLQHYTQGALRCNELGLPLVRSCNTGITVSMDALGRELDLLGSYSKKNQWVKGSLETSIPNYQYRTGFRIWGNTFILSLSYLGLLFGIGGFTFARYKRESQKIQKNYLNKS